MSFIQALDIPNGQDCRWRIYPILLRIPRRVYHDTRKGAGEAGLARNVVFS